MFIGSYFNWCCFCLICLLFESVIGDIASFTDTTLLKEFNPSDYVVSVMIKEEHDILHHWIEYHSLLFGVENVVVSDNGSESPLTQSILREWQAKGVHVYYNQGPFVKKGDIVLNNAKLACPNAKIIIPLDADEFLMAYIPQINHKEYIPTVSLSLIYQDLFIFLHNSTSSILGFNRYYNSFYRNMNDTIETIVNYRITIYNDVECKKSFRISQLYELQLGFHDGLVHNGTFQAAKHMGIYHYHYRNPKITILRALDVVKGYKYLPSNATFDNIHLFIDQIDQHAQKKSWGYYKLKQLSEFIHNNRTLQGPNKDKQDVFYPIGKILHLLKLQKEIWSLSRV